MGIQIDTSFFFMLLHINVIEADGLPKMDADGSCDGYCILELGKQKFKTRVIENSLNPKWRQVFHIPVNNYDNLTLTLMDYDKVGRNDKIAYYQMAIRYMSPGIITDQWFEFNNLVSSSKKSRVHMVMHLSDLNDTPFVNQPFQINLTHFRVIEAQLNNDFEKCYCQVIANNYIQETRINKCKEKVVWEEEFHLITNKWNETTLRLNLLDNKKIIGITEIPLSSFTFNNVEKRWFELKQPDENNTIGKINVAVHIATPDITPFIGETYEQLPVATGFQAYFRVIGAQGLKAMDVGNTSDPYCQAYNIIDKNNKYKTRIVPKTLNPRWNEIFIFDILDFDNSQIKFDVYDHDALNKDDLIGSCTIALTDMGYGTVNDKWFNLTYGSSVNGSIHILYHIVKPNALPFVENIFKREYLYVHMMEGIDIPKMDLIGKSDPYCKLKLNNSKLYQKTSVMENTLWPLWNETFCFSSVDITNEKLIIEMNDDNVGKDKPISNVEIPLDELIDHMPKEKWIEMKPVQGVKYGGQLHIYLHLLSEREKPFGNMQLRAIERNQKEQKSKDYMARIKSQKNESGKEHKSSSKSKHHSSHHKKEGTSDSTSIMNTEQTPERKRNTESLKPFSDGLTLYVGVLSGTELPTMDSNGLSDPYCILSMKSRKKEQRTSIIKCTLNPTWNEYFALNVLSFNTDVFTIAINDHDDIGRDDKIGTVEVPISSLQQGIPQEMEFNIKSASKKHPNKYAGKVKLEFHLAQKEDKPFVPRQFMLPILNICVTEGKGIDKDSYFRLSLENDINYKSTKVKSNNKWNEQFNFPLTQYDKEKLNVELWQINKKEQEISNFSIPISGLEIGKNYEKTYDIPKTSSKITIILNPQEAGKPSFPGMQILQPEGHLCENVSLNIHLIEGDDIPAMDKNGKSDPYCKFEMVGRKEKAIKSKIIKKTLKPYWNQEFFIEVKSLTSDVLKIGLYDHDDIGSDDKIGKLVIPINSISPGVVNDSWFDFVPHKGVKKGGRVHMIIHLSDKGQTAFYEQPFIPYALNLVICEAKELPKMDITSLSDPYCSVSLTGDTKPQKTKVIDNTLSPQWNQEFRFLVTNKETDSLNIIVRDYNVTKDSDIGSVIIPVKDFDIGYIYRRWFNIQPAKGVKIGGQLRIQVHVAPSNVTPWEGIIAPPPPLPVSDKLEIQVHLIQAYDLPAADANGKADPYAVLSLRGRNNNKVKTRIIEKTRNPQWDEQLRMEILSLGTDVLQIEVIDYDSFGKDSKMSMIEIPLNRIPCGIVQSNTFDLLPLNGYKNGGKLEIEYQITAPGTVPYTNNPFTPYQLNIRIEEIKGVKCNSKRIDSMFSLKLKNDSRAQLSAIKENTLNPKYNQEFYYLVTDPKTDILCFDYQNYFEKNSVIGKFEFPLKDLEYGKTTEQNVSLSPSGSVQFYAQLSAPGQPAFADANLPPPAIDEMTLYVRILEATNVPKMDSNGLSDTYFKIKFEKRKNSKKTEIQYKTLNPTLNQEFQFPVKSFSTDVLKLTLYDHDKIGKDDKIGSLELNIRDLEPGITMDKIHYMEMCNSNHISTSVHLITHLAAPSQPKYTNMPFTPWVMNIGIIEAVDIPKTDKIGKSDPYCLFGLSEDIKMKKTNVLDNTLTPQWYGYYNITLTDPRKDIFKLIMKDDGDIKDTLMSTLEIPISSFQFGHVTDKWYDLVPSKSFKNGGKIRLIVHVDYASTPAFEGIHDPKHLILCNSMQLCIKLIEAKDIPTMDVSGSDAYCVMEFIGHEKSIQKSRIIDNSLNPRWNQEFMFDVLSINSDIFKIKMIDHDSIGKDDPISETSLQLRSLEPGVVYDKWIEMQPLGRVRKGGNLHIVYHLANKGDNAFVQKPFNLLETHFRLSEITGLPDQENYFCEIKLENDIKPSLTVVSNSGVFYKDERFILRDPSIDTIKLILNKQYMNNNIVYYKQFGFVDIPINMFINNGNLIEKEIELSGEIKCKAHIFGIILPINTQYTFGFPTIVPFLAPQRYAHFWIKEARNLPRADGPKGLIDAYCKVYALITTKERLKDKKKDNNKRDVSYTRMIPKSLNPEFNQIFHIPVNSFGTDTFKIVLYDYDKNTKDDKICEFEYHAKDMGNGLIKDEWKTVTSKTGELHIVSQITDSNQYAFVESNSLIKPSKLNVCVHDAYDIPKVDKTSKNDCYCKVYLQNDICKSRTKIIQDSSTPQWKENFSFLMNSYLSDVLIIEVFDDGNVIDRGICRCSIPLNQFQPNMIYDDYFDLKSNSETYAGKIHLKIDIDLSGNMKPFTDPSFIYPSLPPCNQMQFHIKIIEANDLPSSDINSIDPYCKLEFIGHGDTKRETRVIDKSFNPFYNQHFAYDVLSLNTDIFKISIYDKDKLSKDDFISSTLIQLKMLEPGVVYNKWLEMKPEKLNKGGKLNVIYHLANKGDIPFVHNPFVLYGLNFRLSEFTELSKQSEYYCEIQLENDIKPVTTVVSESGLFNQECKMILREPSIDVLILKLYEDIKKDNIIVSKQVASSKIYLSQYQIGQTYEQTIDFNGDISAKAHIYSTILPLNTPFSYNLPTIVPFVSSQRYAHFIIHEAHNVPKADCFNKPSDSYVKIYTLNTTKKTIKGKKLNKEKRFLGMTRMVPNSSNPIFRQVFHVPIQSFGTDIIKVALYDHDKCSKDDKLCKFSYKVSDMGNGKIIDEWKQISSKTGEIHITSQVTDINQPAFVENIFTPAKIYICVHDAFDLPRRDKTSKNDCYCKISLDKDISKFRTKTIANSSTPQWFEQFSVILNDPTTDILNVQIYDDGVSKKKISELKLPINQFQPNITYDDDFDMAPSGKVHLKLHLDLSGIAEPFSAPSIPKSFSPVTQMQFCVHLVSGSNFPAMDGNGKCDPYCKFELIDHKNTVQKSRVIDKTLTPFYNQYFYFDVQSLNSDVFKMSVFDYDALSKNDLIGTHRIQLKSLEFGKVYDEVIHPKPSKFVKEIVDIKMRYHLVQKGQIPFINQPFIPLQLHFHLSQLNEHIDTNDDVFFRIGLEKDISYETTVNRISQIWEENFSLFLTDQNTDKLVLKGYKFPSPSKEKMEPKKICETIIPVSKIATIGQVTDLSDSLIKCYGQILPLGQEYFKDRVFDVPRPLETSDKYMLNVRLIEAISIQPHDINMSSDPYCEIKLKKRKGSKIYSPVIRHTLYPKWNYIFQKEIKSLQTDIIQLKFRDYDIITKDEFIGKVVESVSALPFGKILDKWYDLKDGGSVHILFHLTAPGQIPFVEQEFIPYQLHIKVNEAIYGNRALSNVSLFSSFCKGMLSNDVSFFRTSKSKPAMSPQWFETFSVLVNNPVSDSLELTLLKKKKLPSLAKLTLPLNNFEIGKTYEKWYDCSNEYKDKINVRTQILPLGETPFTDFVEELQKVSSSNMMFHIKVVEGSNIISKDSGDCSDPYVVLELGSKPNEKFQTRCIENSKNPKWNQEFHFDVFSLAQDYVEISVYDRDVVSKDDLLGKITLNYRELEFGVPNDKWYTFNGGELHLITHLAAPGTVSYQASPFVPNELHVRVTGGDSSKPQNRYLSLRLDGDLRDQYTTIRNQYIDDFHFIMTEQKKDLLIQLWEHTDKKKVKDKSLTSISNIKLNECEIGNIYSTEIEFDGSKFKFEYQITQICSQPFNISPLLLPKSDEKTRVYLRILEGAPYVKTIRSYCRISLLSQKNSPYAYTRIAEKGRWDDMLSIDIIGVNRDNIHIELMNEKNKVVTTLDIPVINIGFGMIKDSIYTFNDRKSTVRIIAHLAGQTQDPFVSMPYNPYQLHVFVAEALDLPKVDKLSKNDPYCEARLKTDIIPTKTKVIDDSQTPQWFENLDFYLTTMNDSLIVTIFDKNPKFDKSFGEIEIQLNDLQVGVPIYKWYNMKPLNGFKKGCYINLCLLLQPFGAPLIDPEYIKYQPIPENILALKTT